MRSGQRAGEAGRRRPAGGGVDFCLEGLSPLIPSEEPRQRRLPHPPHELRVGPPLPRRRPNPRRHIRQRRLPDDLDPQGIPALLGDLPDDEGRSLPPHLGHCSKRGCCRAKLSGSETPKLPVMHLDPSIPYFAPLIQPIVIFAFSAQQSQNCSLRWI